MRSEIWTKPLQGGDRAVALFNRSHYPYPITIQLKQVGFSGSVHARNLWTHKNLRTLERNKLAS